MIDRLAECAVSAVVFALWMAVRISEKETRDQALMLLSSPDLRDNLLRHAKLWVRGL